MKLIAKIATQVLPVGMVIVWLALQGVVCAQTNAPTITTLPDNQFAVAGGNANFSVTATGTPPIGYQWQFNGTPISNETNGSLTLSNLVTSGTIRVIVSNAWGSVTSTPPATLTLVSNLVVIFSDAALESLVRSAISKPTGSIMTADLLLLTSLSASYNSIINLTGLEKALNLTGLDLSGNSINNLNPLSGLAGLHELNLGYAGITGVSGLAGLTNLLVLDLSGNTINNLTPLSGLTRLQELYLGNNGLTGGGGLAGLTNLTLLDLSANSITNLSPLISLARLQSLNFSYNSIKDANFLAGLTNLTWLSLGNNSITDIAALAGLTQLAYVSLAYNYLDISSNSPALGIIQSFQTRGATVYFTPQLVRPSISAPPQNQTVIAGKTATFTVTANGTAPLGYQWRFNGTNLPGKTSVPLTLTSVQSSQAGNYDVVVQNGGGSVTSAPPATLTVWVPPTITGQPHSMTNVVGATVSLNVTAIGDMPLAYQWRKNNTPIANATNSVLSFQFLALSDAASYAVVITNRAGSITSTPPAILTVWVPPTITSQPQSVTNLVSGTANFSVTATGDAPLAYQWCKNGMPITNAIYSTFSLQPLAVSDAANYTVIITNRAGSVTSTPPAILTVWVPPTIISQPQSVSNVMGGTASFSVTATGDLPLIYQWLKDGTPILNATNSTFSLQPLVLSDAANYTVIVTNQAGSVTSAPPANLTVAPSTYGAPGNLMVTVNEFTGSSTAPKYIAEYTPSGARVRVVADVPWLWQGQNRAEARDLLIGSDNALYLVNGDFTNTLSRYDFSGAGWTSQSFVGWSTIGNETFGGISQLGQYIFAADMGTANDGNTQGVIRFDTQGGAAVRFPLAISPLDIYMGPDNNLYALDGSFSPLQTVYKFDPTTFALLGSNTVASADYRGLAVAADGTLFLADSSGVIRKYSATGTLLNSVTVSNIFFSDIDINAQGQIALGSAYGEVVVTDLSLNTFVRFFATTNNIGTPAFGGNVFVAWVPQPPPQPATLSGLIRDGLSQAPLAGVSISVTDSDAQVVSNLLSDAQGTFHVTMNPGDYRLDFTKPGYFPTFSTVTLASGQDKQLDTVLMGANNSGNGNAQGSVINALTGQTMSGITLNFRAGAGITTGSILATATTDGTGIYQVSLSGGTYTAEAASAGFISGYTTVAVVGGQTISNQNITITPQLTGNAMRMVLTWGASPSDLDSHLTGPLSAGGRFHIYYVSKGSTNGSPYANLDVDDITSYGPETVTISQFFPGTYVYSIFDYSDGYVSSNTALSSVSDARVRVFSGSQEVGSYPVPVGKIGTIWTVFQFDGSTKQIKSINEFSTTDQSTGLESLRWFRWSAASLNIGELQNQAVLMVERLGGAENGASVTYYTTNLTAQAGRDYTAVNGTLVFAPGEATKQITIPVIHNGAAQGGTFAVNLSAPASGWRLATPSVTTITIANSPARPIIPINDGIFGFQTNQFRFNVIGSAGQVAVIEVSTNLTTWRSLATNTLVGSSYLFSDPATTNYSRRFYRVRWQ